MKNQQFQTPQQRAEAKRDRPWTEVVPNPEWLEPSYHGIARPFQIIYETLTELGYSIDYHRHVSDPETCYLWGLYKDQQQGYVSYDVAEDLYLILNIKQPDPRPEIPDGVIWQE
jgi:hypothetical protein